MFEEAIKQFKAAKTETHQIIAYNIQTGTRSQYSSTVGFQLEMWAGAFTETVIIAGDGKRRHTYQLIEDSPVNFPGVSISIYNCLESHMGEQYGHQVPWTPENEKFFIWIKDRMTELITKLGELNQPDLLIEMVNAGRLLPLGNQKEEK